MRVSAECSTMWSGSGPVEVVSHRSVAIHHRRSVREASGTLWTIDIVHIPWVIIPSAVSRSLVKYCQILIIFGWNISSYFLLEAVMSFPTSPNWCFCTTWGRGVIQQISPYSNHSHPSLSLSLPRTPPLILPLPFPLPLSPPHSSFVNLFRGQKVKGRGHLAD